MSFLKSVLTGAAAGMTGGTVMTAFMMVGQESGMIKEPVPVKLERTMEERTGVHVPAKRRETTAYAMHYGIAALFGAIYGALRSVVNISAIPAGAIYGLAVYALNLAGIGPKLGVTRGPKHERPPTVARRVMMHVVYGIVVAVMSDRMRRQMA